jgi:hypothetical protein
MILDQKIFIKVASSTENFAMQNKSKWDNQDIYIVLGEDNVTPEYTETVLDDAFIIFSNRLPSSIDRGVLVGAVYVAPVQEVAKLGLKVWTE